jgi:hypothetical protein
LSVPHVSYLVLTAIAAIGGTLAVPVNSLARLFLTVLVPEEQRRSAFSLDTILAELSFVFGPMLGVLALTQLSAVVAMSGMGVCMGLVSLALYASNLPIDAVDEHATSNSSHRTRPPLRTWLDGRLTEALVVTMGTLFTLARTEVATVAVLRENGDAAWAGVVMAMMAVPSIAGGMVHGAIRRSLPQATLTAAMAALTAPVGLLGTSSSWWWLGVVSTSVTAGCVRTPRRFRVTSPPTPTCSTSRTATPATPAGTCCCASPRSA